MIFNGLESRLARFVIVPIRTATKRASGGKSANNNTAGRRLGAKKAENEFVTPGQIIWRQRGTKWYPGENAGIGRDHTIFAKEPGFVRFYRDPFHAKRRFIGIALGKDDRLPTPHFEPRKRRFGYTPIDNEEVAEHELEYLTRKDTQRLKAREAINAQRVEAKAARMAEYKKVLMNGGITDTTLPLDTQLARLDSVFQFMCGGMSYVDARQTVDEQLVEDLDLDLQTGRLSAEEHRSALQELLDASKKVDAVAAFGAAQRKLVPIAELEQSLFEKVEIRVAELAKPHLESPSGTPPAVVEEVLSLLADSPALTAHEIAWLKRLYLRRPQPVLLAAPEQVKEFDAQVKLGNGQIRNVWDTEKNGLSRYYVPTGARLTF